VSDELPLRRELQAYLAWLGGGKTPNSNARDALETVERISQIEQALSASAGTV
jgi:hypothetical protein